MEKELAIMQDNIVMTTIEFGANSIAISYNNIIISNL